MYVLLFRSTKGWPHQSFLWKGRSIFKTILYIELSFTSHGFHLWGSVQPSESPQNTSVHSHMLCLCIWRQLSFSEASQVPPGVICRESFSECLESLQIVSSVLYFICVNKAATILHTSASCNLVRRELFRIYFWRCSQHLNNFGC